MPSQYCRKLNFLLFWRTWLFDEIESAPFGRICAANVRTPCTTEIHLNQSFCVDCFSVVTYLFESNTSARRYQLMTVERMNEVRVVHIDLATSSPWVRQVSFVLSQRSGEGSQSPRRFMNTATDVWWLQGFEYVWQISKWVNMISVIMTNKCWLHVAIICSNYLLGEDKENYYQSLILFYNFSLTDDFIYICIPQQGHSAQHVYKIILRNVLFHQ